MKYFQSFRLDTPNQCLWRGKERVPIPPKAYDLLRHLVENPGRLVTPDELLEKLWPETYVNPEILRKYILDIRRILGDRPDKPEFIETVTKRGYRFIAPVSDESVAEPPDLPISNAAEEHAAEEKVGHETAPSAHESSSRKSKLRRLAIIAVLAVVTVAGISGYFRLVRNGPNAASMNNTSIAVLPFED